MTDRELLQNCSSDISLFEELVQRYEGKLNTFIRRISSLSQGEIYDLLQEIFISVWKNMHAYDPTYAVSTWIYRIARNATIDHVRKKRHHPTFQALSLEDGGYEWIPDEKAPFWEELDRKVEKGRLAQALDKLPLKYKELIVLRYFEDKSYDEISDILKRPPGTVATHVHRAKEKLRALYDTDTLPGLA